MICIDYYPFNKKLICHMTLANKYITFGLRMALLGKKSFVKVACGKRQNEAIAKVKGANLCKASCLLRGTS